MTTVPCVFTPQPCHESGNLARLLTDVPDGLLTDEHSQSSYGMPVLLEPATGRLWGSGDLRYGSKLSVMLEAEEGIPDLCYRAKDAGYTISILRRGEPISHLGQPL